MLSNYVIAAAQIDEMVLARSKTIYERGSFFLISKQGKWIQRQSIDLSQIWKILKFELSIPIYGLWIYDAVAHSSLPTHWYGRSEDGGVFALELTKEEIREQC